MNVSPTPHGASDQDPHADGSARSGATTLRRGSRAAILDAALINVRRVAGGVEPQRRTLHARSATARAGEPDRAEVLSLAADGALTWPASALDPAMLGGRVIEWLVLSGAVRVDGEQLRADDFLRHPLAAEGHRVEATAQARVFVRMGVPVIARAPERICTRGADAAWDGDPASLQRRVLWGDEAEVALLIRAAGGVAIAPHRHRVDEECLVIDGDIVTGDVLVRAGDYQLAPAGCVHRTVRAVTDVLVYLRGDTEHEFVAEDTLEAGP